MHENHNILFCAKIQKAKKIVGLKDSIRIYNVHASSFLL